MTYQRKTRDAWIIQQYWGSQYGWEDVTEEETYKAGRIQLKTYRENQPEAPARLIMRRERIVPNDPLFIGVYPEGIVYSDRIHEEYGDYKKLGFLDYRTLILTINDDCTAELKARIEAHAAKIQAQRGQPFNIDVLILLRRMSCVCILACVQYTFKVCVCVFPCACVCARAIAYIMKAPAL